jgi:uncharacterized protein YcnI
MRKSLGVIGGVLAAVGSFLVFGQAVSAHVTVKPAEVPTSGFQVFTVSVPNEKALATTSVKLVVPDGLKHVFPTQKPGWNIAVERAGNTADGEVQAITWSGSIGVGLRDEFSFSAQAPANQTTLQWKAYQTYSDGVVVAWDKDDTGDEHGTTQNSGPFSVTTVAAVPAAQKAMEDAQDEAASASARATRATAAAAMAVALALGSLYFGTKARR